MLFFSWTTDDYTPPRKHGFLLSGDTFTTINVPGRLQTHVSGINDWRQIVGFYLDATFGMRGFLWSEGIFTAIDVPGSVNTSVSGINNRGQIVGSYSVFFQGTHGFLATPTVE